MTLEFTGFPKAGTKFLAGLSKDNSKEWFEAHRSDYEEHLLEPAKAFVMALGKHLKKIAKDVRVEPRVNGSIKRMNRDVRFSKDKSPYKDHLDFGFQCGAKDDRRPSFFLRLTPGTVCVGLGYYQFEKDQLDAYRTAVADPRQGAALQKALDVALANRDYAITEPAYKRVPRGFEPDHPRADLLRRDALSIFCEHKAPRELHSEKFVDWCASHYRPMAPVFKWLEQLS